MRVLTFLLAVAPGLALTVFALPHTDNCGDAYGHTCTSSNGLWFGLVMVGIALILVGIRVWKAPSRRGGGH